MAKKIPDPTILQVQALGDLNIPQHSIAKAAGVHVHTVAKILSGGLVARDGRVVDEWRTRIKNEMLAGILELSRKTLIHAETKLHKASFYQAVGSFGLLLDKARLLMGESTENVAHVHQVQDLDRLGAALGRLLLDDDARSEQGAEKKRETAGS